MFRLKKIYKEYKIKLKHTPDPPSTRTLYKTAMPRTDHSLETCKDEDGEVVCVNYSDSVCVGVRAHE